MNYLKLYEKLKEQGMGALPTETLEKISQRYLKNFDRKTEVILWAYLAYQMDSFHKKCAYPYPDKQTFYRRGLRAMSLIQSGL